MAAHSWSMGTCVPDSLLGPTGILTLKQQNIESIRLVTNGICRGNEQSGHGLALCRFSNLKRLSWLGLSSQSDFDSLANMLDHVSHQLEGLEIDLTYHQDWCDHRGYGSDHERRNTQSIAEMLGLSTPPSRKFPVLKRLALTAVPIPEPKRNSSISGSFGFSSLQSLKLQNCDGWWFLFDQLTNRAEPLKLRSLELQCAAIDRPGGKQDKEALVNVLRKTQSLEELFICTGILGSLGIVELWKTVFHHRASLRKFVYHLADFDVDDDDDGLNENFGGTRDIPDFGGFFPGFQETELSALQTKGSLNLTSLGICCVPIFMVSNVRHTAVQRTATDILSSEDSFPALL